MVDAFFNYSVPVDVSGRLGCVLDVRMSSMVDIMCLSLPGVRPARVCFLLCGSRKPMSAPGMYSIGKRICLLFSWLSYNDVVRGLCPLW